MMFRIGDTIPVARRQTFKALTPDEAAEDLVFVAQTGHSKHNPVAPTYDVITLTPEVVAFALAQQNKQP